ncbi:MAG: cytochrome P450 [Pseudomonadota bacterium]
MRTLLFRIFTSWRADLLHYIPKPAYTIRMRQVPFTPNRNIYIVNAPETVREIMFDKVDQYPKSDILTSSLDPLVGNSIFTVSGEQWRRQHRMIEQVFSKLRLKTAYETMQTAMHDYEKRLDAQAGGIVNLDEEMAFATADIIFRTMFSRPIDDADAMMIFKEFTIYQESLPHFTGRRMFRQIAHKSPKLPARALEACSLIRSVIAKIVDERLSGAVEHDDICQIICTCKDPETGQPFTREEMISQIAVFFLAGHETSASALTWTLLCLSQDDYAADKLRDEVYSIVGDGDIPFEALNRMKFASAIFKEGLRLYPPVSFITRYALKTDKLRDHHDIKPDDLMVISPWLIHRHQKFWKNADRFDPDRFVNDRTGGGPNGAWLPFGAGPRVCIGAAFANAEASLILGTLTRRYKLTPLDPHKIEPVARLTVRPRDRVRVRVELRERRQAEAA